jgi:hypothetical protein
MGTVTLWLRCLPLIPGIMGSSPNRVRSQPWFFTWHQYWLVPGSGLISDKYKLQVAKKKIGENTSFFGGWKIMNWGASEKNLEKNTFFLEKNLCELRGLASHCIYQLLWSCLILLGVWHCWKRENTYFLNNNKISGINYKIL